MCGLTQIHLVFCELCPLRMWWMVSHSTLKKARHPQTKNKKGKSRKHQSRNSESREGGRRKEKYGASTVGFHKRSREGGRRKEKYGVKKDGWMLDCLISRTLTNTHISFISFPHKVIERPPPNYSNDLHHNCEYC